MRIIALLKSISILINSRILILIGLLFFVCKTNCYANPIISGISSNEINIDTQFKGSRILLFGAKRDAGDIIIVVRGPKKSFLITKKEKIFGVWHNGERIRFEDSYSFYSLFSTSTNANTISDNLLYDFEIGKNFLKFNSFDKSSKKTKDDFKLQLIDQLEKKDLYLDKSYEINFLDETLFKVFLDFAKNIIRGTYLIEIYLIKDDNILSFQSIPIYVNQVGISAKISDFAKDQDFLYGLGAVILALLVGWIINYLFIKFIGK